MSKSKNKLAAANSKNQAVGSKVQAAGLFLNKYAFVIALCLLMVMQMSMFVFASTADDLWNDIMDELSTWINRLGILVIFVGGVIVGTGWMNDDGARKTSGFNVIIAGAIIMAVVNLLDSWV